MYIIVTPFPLAFTLLMESACTYDFSYFIMIDVN